MQDLGNAIFNLIIPMIFLAIGVYICFMSWKLLAWVRPDWFDDDTHTPPPFYLVGLVMIIISFLIGIGSIVLGIIAFFHRLKDLIVFL